MKAPKLTCVISGQSRVTSENYLRQKADRLGKSVDWLLENYVAKNVCSKLRKGEPLSKITDTDISDSRLADLVKNNSKCREEFSFINGVYTPAKAAKAPKAKAPKVVAVKKESTLEEAVTTAVKNVPTAKYEWDPVKETTVLKTSTEVLDDMVNNKNLF